MVFPVDPFPSVGTGSGLDPQRSQLQTESRQVNKVWVGEWKEREGEGVAWEEGEQGEGGSQEAQGGRKQT